MHLRPLRLPPGADLRRTLEQLAAGWPQGGGFVVSGIGSLDGARLRLADAREACTLGGPLEILSLSGSLSPDGAHLHMAVADAQGRVLGGHVGAGCTVRTTAELLVAELPGHRLSRVFDPATGYDELVVRPVAPRDAAPPHPPNPPPPSPPPGRSAMTDIAARLHALGLVLPAPLQQPSGAALPFPWVRVVGQRVLISGHGPTQADGTLARPLGKVGAAVSPQQAYQAARLTGLAILGSLQRELGSLDRIACWVRVFGMVNSAPGFHQQPAVINGFSDLILEVFGPERGRHARSAVGLAELPFDIPVEIEGEVLLA